MVEARDDITADEVFHITLDREAEVIGQVDVRSISDDSGVLKLYRQLVKHTALQHVQVLGDSLRPHESISINLHHSISGDDSDGIRFGLDGEVSILEITCYQELALGILEAGETEVALVECVDMVATKCHGGHVWRKKGQEQLVTYMIKKKAIW